MVAHPTARAAQRVCNHGNGVHLVNHPFVQQVFELVRRIRASGLTVLIVEQNVQQVLKVVDRAYLLETGRIRTSGAAA